jgi:hypothetical protein
MYKIKLCLRLLLLLTLFNSSCSILSGKTSNEPIVYDIQSASLSALVGRKITVVGTSVNLKLGAVVMLTDSSWLWIDDLHRWPEGYYMGVKNAKTLQVTGTLIERNDLPVYIADDTTTYEGIPPPPRAATVVPKGTDLKKARHRYLLKNISHEVVVQ